MESFLYSLRGCMKNPPRSYSGGMENLILKDLLHSYLGEEIPVEALLLDIENIINYWTEDLGGLPK